MRPALLALALVGLLALACTGGDDGVPVLLTRTPTPEATATGTPTATPTAATTPTATPTPRPTRVPAATATPTPRATPAPSPDDLAGEPFSTHDVRLAVEGANYSFWRTEVTPFCPETAVEGQAFWSANLLGSDFGPVYVLWIYPDAEALQADWLVMPGERPELLVEGCELPFGFVWWNENAVMAFQTFLGPEGQSGLGSTESGPGEWPAVPAFLELTP